MASEKGKTTSKTTTEVQLPEAVETADVDPNTVVGAQQNYGEGENPSDKGISGTYPAGDGKLVQKADGQVWPADNPDAFPTQDETDAKAADRASKHMMGADAPELIPPAAGQETNATVAGTSTDPAAAMTVSDLQAARGSGE